MVLRMRLARYGQKNRPFYRIHVAEAKRWRDAKFLENVGTYNPLPSPSGHKIVRLNTDRIKYWLGIGVQPTKRVAYILSKFNLVPDLPLPSDFTGKRPPPFKEIPDWWTASQGEIDMIRSLEKPKREAYDPSQDPDAP